jgi:hypothetical protein
MITPWKLVAALAVAVLAMSSARAGDFFKLAHFGDHRPAQSGFCRSPWRCYPELNFGIGLPYPMPEYAYAPPPSLAINVPPVYSYTTPAGLNVTTYSTPNGAATYSVTQPNPAGTVEMVVPPVPRPKADPALAPGHFHLAPLSPPALPIVRAGQAR